MSQDPYSSYRSFLEQYISLNVLEWGIIKSKLEIVQYKKGDTIHHMGDICRLNYFLNSGIVRSYTLDEKGKDYTWGIHFHDTTAKMHHRFIVDYQSFIDQSPSTLGYEVVEACELVKISYADTQFIYTHFKKGERLGRLMAELAYSEVHRMIIERTTLDAKERLVRFMHNESSLIDKVPQYHIASYLGITPQSLSKLKKALES